MAEIFETDLQLVLGALSEAFYSVIRGTLASFPDTLAFPMVVLHRDLGDSNIMEDKEGRLVGVIDWAEAEVGPFGTDLHPVQHSVSKVHLKNGRIGYGDSVDLARWFWDTLNHGVGGFSNETVMVIKAARVTVFGLSRCWGFLLARS